MSNNPHFQSSVTEFMRTFDQDCPEKPTVPSANIRILRIKLLLEEVLELAEASGVAVFDTKGYQITTEALKEGQLLLTNDEKVDPDLVGVADALADISYVNYGAATAYGMNLYPIEEEVHRSNMTKLWALNDTVDIDGGAFTFAQKGEKFLVKSLDGKVVKSPDYYPANVAQKLLEQEG